MAAWLRTCLARIRWAVTRKKSDADLDREIAGHLDLLAAEHERRGLSPQEARTAARRQFGGALLTREDCGDRQGSPLVAGLLGDLRIAVRALQRSPGFVIGASATLALGIAATTVVFAWLSATLSTAAPIRDMDRLTGVWLHNRAQGEMKTVVSGADFETWRQRQDVFDRLVAQRDVAFNLSGANDPVRVAAAAVTADYFPVFHTQPMLGRAFALDDERVGAPGVAVLGYRFWQRRFDGRAAVLGQTLRLDGIPTTIVGMLPPNDYSADLLVPLRLDQAAGDFRERALFVSARLKPGVSLESAQASMRAIGNDLEREQPEAYRGWSINVRPLQEEFVGPQARLVFGLLAAAAAAVLLIACVNMANLLLVRGLSRARELAVRTALGASRGRLVRQLLAEGAVVAAVGSALSLAVSYAGLRVLRALFEAGAAYMDRVILDWRVVVFTAATAALSVLAFALLPALQATRSAPAGALREGAYGSQGPRTRRLRSALVAGEVALASLLVVLAVLFGRTLVAIQRIPPGFDTRNLLTLRIALPATRYATGPQMSAFFDQALDRLRALPGVTAAGATTRVPAAGSRFNPNRTVIIEGRPLPVGESIFANDLTVSPGYLDALGVPLREGRGVARADGAGAPLALVINETMARRYWGELPPIGARVRLGDEPDGRWRTVVGVVGDIRNDDVDAPPLPHVYVPLAQRPAGDMTIVLRTVGDPLQHVSDVRAAVAAVDPEQPLFDVRSMEQVLSEDLRGTTVLVGLESLFAGVALLLAATGIYGVAAYGVSQSAREIGIRLALGATRSGVVALVARQGLMPVALGLGAGLAASLALSRLLAGILYGVTATDPVTYIMAAAVLATAAVLAAIVPAARAARMDPLRALRTD